MDTGKDYIDYRISKSHEVFADANLLAQNARWNSCVNRLYYSCFYLVTALLYKHKLKSETHNGAKIQFNLHFVKTGIVDKDSGKLYSNLFDWRQESDYADFIDFDEATVLPIIEQTKDFNNKLLELFKEEQ